MIFSFLFMAYPYRAGGAWLLTVVFIDATTPERPQAVRT